MTSTRLTLAHQEHRRELKKQPSGRQHCSSLPDLIGRHLLVEYCGREDLAHV
jgi:hypothetical protein